MEARQTNRFLRFNLVGGLGIVVQLVMIWLMVDLLALDIALSTVVAVTSAVVHNFAWHWRWTWADRHGRAKLSAFTRFAFANGVVSLAGNVIVMTWLTRTTSLPAVPANVLAIVASGLINYWLADRAVFRNAPAKF